MSNRKRQPKFEWLRPIDLLVDSEVQRRIDPAWVAKLTRDFDEDQLDTPYVSRRADGDYVIDGQHRIAALIRMGLGDRKIQCKVYFDLTRQEEAVIFLARNHRTRKPNPFDRFRMELLIGEAEAVEIDKILTAAGLRLAPSGDDGAVSAVEALRRVHRLGVLETTLLVLKSTWGDARSAYDKTILVGLAQVLRQRMDDLSLDRLTAQLAKSGTPEALIGQAKTLAGIRRSTPAVACESIIVDIYNKGLRSGRIE